MKLRLMRKFKMIKMLAKYIWWTIKCPHAIHVRHLAADLAGDVNTLRSSMVTDMRIA